jgi:nitrite reductase (NO-forming)
MKRSALLISVVSVGLLAGCGSSSSHPSSGAPTKSATPASSASSSGALTLSETEFKITPAAPHAAAGKITITVKNNGTIPHALAVQTPSGLKRTPSISAGGTATLTIDVSKAGTYTFYCPLSNHRALGMQGELVVGGASGSGGSAPATTSTSGGGGGGGYMSSY